MMNQMIMKKTKGKEVFSLRAAQMEDIPEIVELMRACEIAQTGKASATKDQVVTEWTNPKFDMQKSTRVAVDGNGRILGVCEVWDTRTPPVANWVWARTHPECEGQGVGTAFLAWVEERLQETISRVPADLMVTFASGAESTHTPSKELLENNGMTLNRHFWHMVIDMDNPPPEPVWPENIRVITYAERPDLLTTYRAFNDSFKDHWGHVDQPEEEQMKEWEHWVNEDKEHESELWFLAMDGDEIAGLSLCRRKDWEDPDMAHVNILGVRRAWRKQGLGLALLHHSFGVFYRRGQKQVSLGVDAGSLTGATRLYEKAGMVKDRQFDSYEKELRPGRDIRLQTL